MEEKGEAAERVPRLVDIGDRVVYKLEYKKQLIASSAYLGGLGNPNIGDSSVVVPVRCAFYIEVADSGDREATVRMRSGSMIVGGEMIGTGMEKKNIAPGSLLQVGDVTLQFQISNLNGGLLNIKRLLPRTPRQLYQTSAEVLNDAGSAEKAAKSAEEQDESHVDEALRAQLKRISKEIYGRKDPDHRPPPPYEQVANNIGYQLLLHSRKSISAAFVQSFYPLLKKLERLEPSVVDMYKDYIKVYEEARGAGATPQCMHPADVPTVQFIVQLIFHMCSHPALTEVAADSGPSLMQLLAIFSESPQNHAPLVQCKSWSYLLSTMKLTLMVEREAFQRYGWITLGHLLHAPPVDDKLTISEQVLILALDIATIQLDKMVDNAPLATAVIRFLSILATKATRAVSNHSHKGRIFTAEQGAQVLQMLHSYEVLRHLMDLPQDLRRDMDYSRAYHALIRAMAPITKDSNLRRASGGPSSHGCTKVDAPPTVMQLVKLRAGLPPQSAPPTLPPAPQHLLVASGQQQSMRLSSSLFSISSHAERKHRKLPLIPQPKKSQSLKVRSERRARSLGEDQLKEVMASPEAVPSKPPKPPRSPRRLKAHSAVDSQHIPKSVSEFNILFIASQDEPLQQLGQSLDLPTREDPKAGQDVGNDVKGAILDGVALGDRQASQNVQGPIQTLAQVPPQAQAQVSQQGPLPPAGSPPAAPQKELSSGDLGPAVPRVSRPNTWRASVDDPLNAEVNRLLSELTVCPEVLTSSLPSPARNSPPWNVTSSITTEAKRDSSAPLAGLSGMAVGDGVITSEGVLTEDTPSVVLRRKKGTPNDQVMVPKTPSDQVMVPKTPSDQVMVPKTPSDQVMVPKTPNDQVMVPKTPSDQVMVPKTPSDQVMVLKTPNDQVMVPKTPNDQVMVPKTPSDQVMVPKTPSDQVMVPKTSLNYFRQSIKRKKGGVASQGGHTHDLHHASSLPEEVDQTMDHPWRGNRRSWSQSSQLMELPPGGQDPSQLFEMSGVHLSSESAALEGIVAEHGDIIEALEGRQEVLDTIQGLWYGDKGLQAATNAVMACFSEDNDVSLFTDVLQLFSSFTPPWSLSVCLVVLPTLQQLLLSLREPHHLKAVCSTILWIVEHFSELILTYRIPQRSQRLQALEDREKKIMCYRQLHQVCEGLGKRLESSGDPAETSQHLTSLHASLQPFSEPEIITSPPP